MTEDKWILEDPLRSLTVLRWYDHLNKGINVYGISTVIFRSYHEWLRPNSLRKSRESSSKNNEVANNYKACLQELINTAR